MAPRILIFLIAMGGNYSFERNSIETYAPLFFGDNDLFLSGVFMYGVHSESYPSEHAL